MISIQGPRAGEVARQEIGRSGDWLRKLERAGVIPAAPRDFNGYRVYPPEFVGASTVGRLPYGLADESWAALRDAFGQWRGVCADHREAVAWASSRLPQAPAMDGRRADEA